MVAESSLLLGDITLVIVGTTLFAFLAKKLRQPIILAYLVTGMIIGPAVLGLVSNLSVIQTLSQLGVAFLLFIVGLELDLRKLKDVSRAAVVAALVQFVGAVAISWLISRAFGFEGLSSFYLALALGFSSTILVVKLLTEKNELDTLHGRIALGILLVQDALAVLALILLTSTGGAAVGVSFALAKALLILAVAVLGRKLLERIFHFVAESQELLFLFSVSWCFLFAGLAAALGFSIAIGSFLAGVSLATFPYNLEIIGRVKSIKDFFSTIFFVSLGMMLSPAALATAAESIASLSLVSLVAVPILIFVSLSLLGYERKTGFFVGTSLAQVSEFSLILVTQGAVDGNISQGVVLIITAVAGITMVASSYFIHYSERLYRLFSRFLMAFPGRIREAPKHKLRGHTVLFGCHRMGGRILEGLKGPKVVVDFNPETVKELLAMNIPVIYGNMEDLEVLEGASIRTAGRVISTVPSKEDNLLLIHQLRGTRTEIVVTAKDLKTAKALYEAGAHYVVLPEFLSGEKIFEMVRHHNNFSLEGAKHRKFIERLMRKEEIRRQAPDFLAIFQGVGGHKS